MNFDLESVVLGYMLGESGAMLDGLCLYDWSEEHRNDSDRCAYGRAVTTFAGVWGEYVILKQHDPWENFGVQTDDLSKMQEVLSSTNMQDQDAADEWQWNAWLRSEELVRWKRTEIRRVAKALQKKRHLTGDEVRTLASPRFLGSKTASVVIAAVVMLITFKILTRLRK